MGLFTRIREATGVLFGWAGGAVQTGVERAQSLIAEVQNAAPVIQKVGYRLTDIDVEVSISPRVILHLQRDFLANAEQFTAVLAEVRGRRTVTSLVKALQQANRIEPGLRISGRQLDEIEVELGIPPALRLRYRMGAHASTRPENPPMTDAAARKEVTLP